MEREIMLTGVGGQGVQLAASVLAQAAVIDGLEVLMLGTYGGTMRGGNTDSTIIVADGPISAPPIVSSASGALVMHHQFWAPTQAKLRDDAVVVLNASVFDAQVGDFAAGERANLRVYEVEATRLAGEAGNAMAASLVLAAAFARVTGVVGLEAMVEAMKQSVPSYRRQHLAVNEAALRVGFDALPEAEVSGWIGAAA